MSQKLATFGYPNLGGASNRSAPAPMGEHSFKSLRTNLDHTWQGILLDFRERVQRNELHLLGVQTAPERHLHESLIPGQWDGDFRIDALASTIEVGPYRYVNVVVLSGPPDLYGPSVSESPTVAAEDRALRPQDVVLLDDDTILALLEEHAKRVVESTDAKLIAPGKISVMPIIRRKMLWRFEAGEVAPRLVDEAKSLAAWIATKVPSHQVPTTGRIENALRDEYRSLSALSNGTKPRLLD
jgi:hypothetical protein